MVKIWFSKTLKFCLPKSLVVPKLLLSTTTRAIVEMLIIFFKYAKQYSYNSIEFQC